MSLWVGFKVGGLVFVGFLHLYGGLVLFDQIVGCIHLACFFNLGQSIFCGFLDNPFHFWHSSKTGDLFIDLFLELIELFFSENQRACLNFLFDDFLNFISVEKGITLVMVMFGKGGFDRFLLGAYFYDFIDFLLRGKLFLNILSKPIHGLFFGSQLFGQMLNLLLYND